MTDTTSASQSLWLTTAPATSYPSLSDDLDVDVAVIGAGITGLTTALMLQREGKRVAVLEAAQIGTGVTGCTTAKVSALQSTMYSTICARHGQHAATVYAQASLAGVERVATLTAEQSIECDLERRPAYTYAACADERPKILEEAEAAARAGLPVELVEGHDLPYPTFGAVRLAEQIQIHPVRYVQGLAAAADAGGTGIYVSTRACGVEETKSGVVVHTNAGAVRSEHVVVATHAPILDRGFYFARMSPHRSYCIAAKLASGTPPHGMSITAGTPVRSIRSYQDLLVVGGEGHPTGSERATPERFRELETFARTHWDIDSITHRWSAQDPTHYDHLPVIGAYHPHTSRLWVASGFMKWGLATATFAAQILTDLISGRPNTWADTFSPTRLSARQLPDVAKVGANLALTLVGDQIRRAPSPSAAEIPRQHALIVAHGRRRVATYRDEHGIIHAVSARCPHMGCLLRFNSAETSWDCPCHGSRFDVDGRVLEGPATRHLDVVRDDNSR